MKTVIYARISNEEQLNSINNQIEICQSYAKEQGIIIDDIYFDQGYSGSNFNRPGFKRLIEDIENNKIKTILIKDLSRIGRSFLETSYYLEEYFLNHQISLISINDNLSVNNEENEIILPIKNYMNELYIKECRKKRLNYLETHKDKTLFSYSLVYGYLFNNGKIIVDESKRQAILLIFKMYLKDKPIKQIIDELVKEKYEIPGFSKNQYKIPTEKKYQWKSYMIYRILNTKEYTGTGINLKTKKIKNHRIKNHNFVELSNRYPVIIDKNLFDEVRTKLASKTNKKLFLKTNEKDLITSLVLYNDFNYLLEFLNKDLVEKYEHKIKTKIKYFHKISELERKIINCIETSENSKTIEKYNNQIKLLKKDVSKQVNDFINFLNELKNERYKTLSSYLVNNIEIVKNNNKIVIRINYFFN